MRVKQHSDFPVWQLKNELEKRKISQRKFAETLGVSIHAITGLRQFPEEKIQECMQLLKNWNVDQRQLD